MELSEEIEEPQRGGILQSTSKRVRMIFSVMASPNRIDILRILNSKGPLTYSELKSLAGFKSKKESGKFAYHLRKLLRQSLVALNKSERRYTITNLGKLVLSLARQIEERSIIESGKMYVRTSHESIEEFNSHKIIQSLVREGSLPLELAQKITEEVENRIYKYQTTYLTGSLIREMVNSVLLEHGYEEYRNKLARLGLPVFDVQEMLANVTSVDNGAGGLLLKTGQKVFAEHLITNTLPKDVQALHELVVSLQAQLRLKDEMIRLMRIQKYGPKSEKLNDAQLELLEGEPGVYRLKGKVATIEMPATVQAILAARIDRLAPNAKRVLQCAAVIGHHVLLHVLNAVVETENGELRQCLADLQTAEFLYEARLFPELMYTFKHALTHEVAYRGVLQDRRRLLHRNVGIALEELYPDHFRQMFWVLQSHYERAEAWDRVAKLQLQW